MTRDYYGPDPDMQERIELHRGIRQCLKCGREFTSDGAWNRICYRCGVANEGQYEKAFKSKDRRRWQ